MTFITSPSAPVQLTQHGAIERFSALATIISEYFRIRRAVTELQSLSPEMLKDIGIERSEAERVARFGRRGS